MFIALNYQLKQLLKKSLSQKLLCAIKKIYLFLVLLLVVVAIIMNIIIGFNLNENSQLGFNSLLKYNIGLIIFLFILVIYKSLSLIRLRIKQIIGTRIKTKLLSVIVSLIIVPMLILTLVATIFFSGGLRSWFGDSVRQTIDSSIKVTQLFQNEFQKDAKSDLLILKSYIKDNATLFTRDPLVFEEEFKRKIKVIGIKEAYIFFLDNKTKQAKIFIGTKRNSKDIMDLIDVKLVKSIKNITLDAVKNKENIILIYDQIKSINNAYLLVVKEIDDKLVNHIKNLESAKEQYDLLYQRIESSQIKFIILFVSVVLIIFLSMIWISFYISSYFLNPIVEIMRKYQNFYRQHRMHMFDDKSNLQNEFEIFYHIFEKLELLSTTDTEFNAVNKEDREMDSNIKYEFLESILGEMESSVLVINDSMEVKLFNNSANLLLLDICQGKIQDNLEKKSLQDFFPELERLIKDIDFNSISEDAYKKSLSLKINGTMHLILVKIVKCKIIHGVEGYIINLEDITYSVSSLCHSNVSQVTGLMLENIKNPIKPMIKSINKLEKNLLVAGLKNRENIVANIAILKDNIFYIRKLLLDFISYAKFQELQLKKINLSKVILEIFDEYQHYNNEYHMAIKYELDFSQDKDYYVYCDYKLIYDIIICVITNSIESIQKKNLLVENYVGKISFSLVKEDKQLKIIIKDNGVGIKKEFLGRIDLPYVTTKIKSSGLGLATVRKVMELHSGTLNISNLKVGTKIELIFNI